MSTILPIEHKPWKKAVVTAAPELVAEYFQFREYDCRKMDVTPGTWVVQGKTGVTINGVPNLCRLNDGDYVCRLPAEHDYVWVVTEDFFKTYYSPSTE